MAKHHSKISFLTLLFALLLLGCEKYNDSSIKNIRFVPELGYDYDSIVSIDSKDYFLDAYLWRDFMPISPSDGKPLISINWLISKDSTAIPNNIELTQQFVIYDDLVWISQYENETRPSLDYKLERLSRNGPKWGPFITVKIVAKITDTKTKNNYYLKLDRVRILRTD